MFKNHRKSVDHILLAMASLDEGDMQGAAEHLQAAQEEPDFDVALEEMNDANEQAFEEDFEEGGKKCSTSSLRRALAEALEDEEEEEGMEDEEPEDEEDMGQVTARLSRARRNLRALRSR